jgi:hypothetical protein
MSVFSKPFLPCWWPDIAPSDGVGGAGDGNVASHVVAQVGHVVAVAHEPLADSARHELRDNGGCRQLRGNCGGQQGERAEAKVSKFLPSTTVSMRRPSSTRSSSDSRIKKVQLSDTGMRPSLHMTA